MTLLKKKTENILSQTKWYHGTTLSGFKNIKESGIVADYNNGTELDFGPGFYLAPNQSMAERFILKQVQYLQEQFRESGLTKFSKLDDMIPVVIEFNFCPMQYSLDNGVEILVFEKYDELFAEFVVDNRLNAREGLIHSSSLVYGVMSDSNPINLVFLLREGELSKEEVIQEIATNTSSSKQLSIHKQEICDILTINKAMLLSSGRELDING